MIKQFLFGMVILATANIQMGQDARDYGKEFSNIIVRASIRLQKAAEVRPLKIRKWNDSLEKTAKAAALITAHAEPEQIFQLLASAREDYPQNSFSHLLQAVLLSAQEKPQEANIYFEAFLLESRTFTEFEEPFLRWAEFHMLRNVVYHILKSRGVNFEGRETQIQVRVPYEAFFRYVMDPGREDWVFNLLFIAMILGGGVALIIASLSGVEFSTSRAGTLAVMYLIVWIAYGLWIFDLAFGLPFAWNRHAVVLTFLSISLGFFAIAETMNYIAEKNKPLESGYRHCQFCKGVILELATECNHCRRKV